jgi:hypothetical protein
LPPPLSRRFLVPAATVPKVPKQRRRQQAKRLTEDPRPSSTGTPAMPLRPSSRPASYGPPTFHLDPR